jgi:hypothetical protein
VIALVSAGVVDAEVGEKKALVRTGEVLFPRAGLVSAQAGAQGALLLTGDQRAIAEIAPSLKS